MSNLVTYGRRIGTTAAGIGLIGAGLATGAFAAPAAAPAPPKVNDLPVPVLHQPVDASSGLPGVPRGAVPGIGTKELQQTPGAEAVPGLEIVPLPKAEAPAETAADTTGAEPQQAPTEHAAEQAPTATAAQPPTTEAEPAAPPQAPSGGSALAGLDQAGFLSGLAGAVPAG